MIRHELYIRNDSDKQEVEEHIVLLKKAKELHSCDYCVINTDQLTEEKRKGIRDEIRGLAIDGISVKTQGRGALPISRGKNKLGKIPILVTYKDNKPKNVYPHAKDGKRNDAVSYLNKLITSNDINEVFDSESISERDISKMISSFPELIGEGLKFDDTEVTTEYGRIDAVFEAPNDDRLLIEIEIEAGDNAIGQVQRFKPGYLKKCDIPEDKIRLGIVCVKISDSRLNACKGAGIEVYTLCLDKKAWFLIVV